MLAFKRLKLIRAFQLMILVLLIGVDFANAQSPARNRPPMDPEALKQSFYERVSTVKDTDSLLLLYLDYGSTQARMAPQITLDLSEEVLQLEGIPELKRMAFSNALKGRYWFYSQPDSSNHHYIIAQRQFSELEDRDQELSTIIFQARLLSRMNDYLGSEDKYFEALEHIDEFGASADQEFALLSELSSLYIRVGAIDIALERYKNQLEIETGSISDQCRVHLNISNAYKRNQQLDLAYDELLNCAEAELNDPYLEVAIYKSLSDLEKLNGNTLERIKWAERAVEAQNALHRKDYSSYLFLAEAYFEHGDFDESESLFPVLDNFDPRLVQPPVKINYLLLKGKNSLRKNNPDQALSIADEGLAIVRRMPETPLLIDLQKLKAEALSEKGELSEANRILASLLETKDLIEKRGRIKEEELNKVRFQMRSKNREIAEIHSELGTVKVRNALLILFLILAGGYVFYRFRVSQLLREERTRNRIARDLHDDLSATLSSISFFTEAVKRQNEENAENEFLNRIEESAEEAKDMINDIIWAIDPENDDWVTFSTKCKRYAIEIFEGADIEYEMDIDTSLTIDLELETKQDLWLIFKEAISNLARHSKANKAHITLKNEGRVILLSVQDDGIGFKESELKRVNGIKNIKFRADRMGALIMLDSEPGKGCKWEIKVPT